MSLTSNASKNIADRLAWHTASRDQAGITKDLAGGKDIPEVYGLGEVGLFDEFFYFLDRFGFTSLFTKLEPKPKIAFARIAFRLSYAFEYSLYHGGFGDLKSSDMDN